MKTGDNYKKEVDEKMSQKIKEHYGTKNARILFITILIFVNIIGFIVFWFLWGIDTAIQLIVGFLIGTALFELFILWAFSLLWRYSEIPEEIYDEKNRNNR